MTPDDERRIAQYLRCPDALSDDEHRAVEHMMDREKGARAYAEMLETFFDFLDDEDQRAVDPRVDAFVNDLFAAPSFPSVVSVRPFRSKQSSRPTVMAAATTPSASDRRFSVLTTLAADDEDVLVRLIGDWETERGRLYVLTDPPSRQSHAVVSFPEFGLDLVTDESGRLAFDLPPNIEPTEWEEATAVVRQPVAFGRLQPDDTLTLGTEAGAQVQCRRTEGTITVAVQAAGKAASPSLLTVAPIGEEGADQMLLRLPEDEPIRHGFSSDENLMLRVYE